MAGSASKTWREHLTLQSTKSPFDSPVPITHKAFSDIQPVSYKRLNIAGILLTVYGLDELTSSRDDVACMWLLHGRGDTQDSMAYVAAAFLNAWNTPQRKGQRGLICICFDQRNHGSRLIDGQANESWKAGNPHHAVDMWTLFSGTAQDVSMLITHIPSYLSFTPSMHICSGVSLGGHATWQAILSDSRIRAAIIVVGCADYVRLMTDRGIRSKLQSCMETSPPGTRFLGSKDFPKSLVEEVERLDPAGLLLGELDTVTGDDHMHPPSKDEIDRLKPLMGRLASKSLLVLSGGKDRLVEYKHSEPFLTWLKKAVTTWCNDQDTRLLDIVDPNGGHEFSRLMRTEAETWLCQLLAQPRGASRGSRM